MIGCGAAQHGNSTHRLLYKAHIKRRTGTIRSRCLLDGNAWQCLAMLGNFSQAPLLGGDQCAKVIPGPSEQVPLAARRCAGHRTYTRVLFFYYFFLGFGCVGLPAFPNPKKIKYSKRARRGSAVDGLSRSSPKLRES